MAVLLEAWNVVARRTAVEDRLEGDVDGWFRLAPNQTACVGPHLCRIGFMHGRDATEFLRQLEALGLRGEEGGTYREVAILSPTEPWQHTCPWIELGHYAGVQAAWLRGANPEPLVVPFSYRPEARIFDLGAEEAAERFEFLRREGNIEVYRDRQTDQEVYRGRTTEDAALPEDVGQRFLRAVESIEPLLAWDGIPKRLGLLERRRLRKGIAALEGLTGTTRGAWRIWFYLGMARRSARDAQGAYEAFREAYHDNAEHSDVVREYSGQCLALGRGEEAVALARRNCERNPNDASLRSNLALALMIADDMPEAKQQVDRARAMEPDDPITAALARMIDDVLAGRTRRPEKYP
ncbi:tetratricopeptide repeat protein [Paraliomyxa miuraensis]|uniref:tetratricopeptide repeat protein n=1 Tax=Paraliomyxa miuraensis TaxID=376150 RepID=UPI0022555949|nr:hypothetical protein [Paraliomyxa miuraensis]MCX4241619.1 hypothetical protein [Paraliomyxa miuraensis]